MFVVTCDGKNFSNLFRELCTAYTCYFTFDCRPCNEPREWNEQWTQCSIQLLTIETAMKPGAQHDIIHIG